MKSQSFLTDIAPLFYHKLRGLQDETSGKKNRLKLQLALEKSRQILYNETYGICMVPGMGTISSAWQKGDTL